MNSAWRIFHIIAPIIYLVIGIGCLTQTIPISIALAIFCFTRAIQSLDEYYTLKEQENNEQLIKQ
jgi:hypothetical protein